MPTIDILSIDNSLEMFALRSNLEWWGIRANLFLIGKGNDLLEWNKESKSEYVIWGCHGDQDGICLPELAPEIAKEQIFQTHISPSNISKDFDLSNQIVISNGCLTGKESFGKAFKEAGASHYIAPNDYPEGDASLFFLSSLSYFHFCKGLSLDEAFEISRGQDDNTKMFRFY